MNTISQILPKGQKDIIVYALNKREQQLKDDAKRYTGSDAENIAHELFDILTLKALLQYEIRVEMNEQQYNAFTSVNGVDYPQYI